MARYNSLRDLGSSCLCHALSLDMVLCENRRAKSACDGDNIRSLVRAIAERLLLGLAAGAPIICLPRLDIDWIRRFLSNLP